MQQELVQRQHQERVQKKEQQQPSKSFTIIKPNTKAATSGENSKSGITNKSAKLAKLFETNEPSQFEQFLQQREKKTEHDEFVHQLQVQQDPKLSKKQQQQTSQTASKQKNYEKLYSEHLAQLEREPIVQVKQAKQETSDEGAMEMDAQRITTIHMNEAQFKHMCGNPQLLQQRAKEMGYEYAELNKQQIPVRGKYAALLFKQKPAEAKEENIKAAPIPVVPENLEQTDLEESPMEQIDANEQLDESNEDGANPYQYFSPEEVDLLKNHEMEQTVFHDQSPLDKYKNAKDKPFMAKFLMAHQQIPLLRLPEELLESILQVMQLYPKNSIKKAAAKLSALFRIRTGGFGNEMNLDDDSQAMSDDLKAQHSKLIKELSKKPNPKFKTMPTIDTKHLSIVYDEVDAVAYIAHRFPAVYATSFRIMNEIHNRIPRFAPRSMLDFGTGPGTSIFAAKHVFVTKNGGELSEVMAIEPSSAMMDVAMKLFAKDEHLSKSVTWRRFLNDQWRRKFDLVNASFVMNEIATAKERARLLQSLWNHCNNVMILVEPGTPKGFELIHEARQLLLKEKDLTILAPCPHSFACPIMKLQQQKNQLTWCHFSQRIQREVLQRMTKQGATLPYEDEKFSFLVVAKTQWLQEHHRKAETLPAPHFKSIARRYERDLIKESIASDSWARAVYKPIVRGGHVGFDMCTPQGTYVRKQMIVRKQKQVYKYASKLFWNDLVPMDWFAEK